MTHLSLPYRMQSALWYVKYAYFNRITVIAILLNPLKAEQSNEHILNALMVITKNLFHQKLFNKMNQKGHTKDSFKPRRLSVYMFPNIYI